jgi:PAS domain S-box-containing protein
MRGVVELLERGASESATDVQSSSSESEFEENCQLARGTMNEMPTIKWSLGGLAWDPYVDLDATSDPVFVVDSEGHIVGINRNVESLLGYSRDELIGASIETVVTFDRKLEASSKLPRRGVRFIGADRRVQALHRNGQRLGGELVLCATENDSVIVILRAQAPERVSMREEEMAEIVHDLKSPLSTIALEAHLLGDRLATPNQVGRIERNVAYMDRLVHELLDLCSIDAGRFTIERRPTELRSLIERVLERVLPSADRDRVLLDAGSNVVVSCDDGRVERVIANFIENALKYAPPRSAIVVRLAITASHACVSVIDSGPGIPDDETSTLFDKYRRASTARGHNGSGLGLYVSRKIIEAHGGRVGVESRRNVGSRFFFELPVSPRGGAAVEAKQRQTRKPYVLLVDDELEQAAGLSEILRYEGYETAIASTASEALLSVRARRPHTLIVDARLGGTDGVDLLFLLQQEQPAIPSFILTGLPREEPRIATAIRKLGCGYVSKPVDVYRLLALLRAQHD